MNFKHNKKLVNVARMLRKNLTKEERHLWYEYLRDYPTKFTRQKIIGNYIVDFYCAKANLVIELDGSQHYKEDIEQKDLERTKFLNQYGIQVIRIPNNEVNENLEGVCQYIDSVVTQRLNTLYDEY